MKDASPLANSQVRVSFGDCDPAGIVFYPNFFRWSDALFHTFLEDKSGGHAALCKDIGAVGLGLMSVEMSFRSPVAPGDTLELGLTGMDWNDRSLTLAYSGNVGDRLAFRASETRGVFVLEDGRMRAGTTDSLKAKLT
jgi:acyl-CoA thioesterase FadM